MDYSRQLILPQLGPSGQQKLQDSRVLVIGAGGLGCAVLPYLAAAGIGTIGIIDGDVIAASNLHRQLLYTEKQIGLSKAPPECSIGIICIGALARCSL
jgi:adenylyltransferase/sulfurtransferase